MFLEIITEWYRSYSNGCTIFKSQYLIILQSALIQLKWSYIVLLYLFVNQIFSILDVLHIDHINFMLECTRRSFFISLFFVKEKENIFVHSIFRYVLCKEFLYEDKGDKNKSIVTEKMHFSTLRDWSLYSFYMISKHALFMILLNNINCPFSLQSYSSTLEPGI